MRGCGNGNATASEAAIMLITIKVADRNYCHWYTANSTSTTANPPKSLPLCRVFLQGTGLGKNMVTVFLPPTESLFPKEFTPWNRKTGSEVKDRLTAEYGWVLILLLFLLH